MYDILIKNGRIIDPAQNIDGCFDVAINGDKIAALAEDIPLKDGRQLIDAKDKIVTPGLIDMHVHVFDSFMKHSVEPDIAGVKHAVTTVVDGGSAGEKTFTAFPKYIVPNAKTGVFCFIHLCSLGLISLPELNDWFEMDLEAMSDTIEANKDLIKGVKLRLVGKLVAKSGVEVLKTAKKIANQFSLPIMVHIGDIDKEVPTLLTPQCLSVIEAGDILSHVYTGIHGSVLKLDGTLIPELKEAMQLGVILDSATGRNNFSFAVARRCLAEGIPPTVISTDLTSESLTDRTYSLPVNMSKFMALGLSLKDVVAMTTINPALAIHEESRIGSLKPGKTADVSLLELQHGNWLFVDAPGEIVKADRMLIPITAIKRGEIIKAEPVALPSVTG